MVHAAFHMKRAGHRADPPDGEKYQDFFDPLVAQKGDPVARFDAAPFKQGRDAFDRVAQFGEIDA